MQTALNQYGPWQGQSKAVDQSWTKNALVEKVTSIDWKEATEDVTRYLNAAEQQSMVLWSDRFFLNKVENI